MLITDPRILSGMFDVSERNVLANINPAVKLCSNNPQRVGLIFTVVTAGSTAYFSTTTIGGGTRGIALTNAMPPLQFWMHSHGSLPTIEWYVSNAGASPNVTVFEIIYRPERMGGG